MVLGLCQQMQKAPILITWKLPASTSRMMCLRQVHEIGATFLYIIVIPYVVVLFGIRTIFDLVFKLYEFC